MNTVHVSTVIDLLGVLLVQLMFGATVLLAVSCAAWLMIRQQSAAVRHRLWSLSILALLAFPLVTPLLPSLRLRWPRIEAEQSIASMPLESAAAADHSEFDEMFKEEDSRAGVVFDPVTSPELSVAVTSTPKITRIAAPSPAASAISASEGDQHNQIAAIWRGVTLLWVAGAGMLFACWIVAEWTARRMIRRAAAIQRDDILQLRNEIASRIGISRPVDIVCSAETSVPLAAGWLRSVILLPAGYGNWIADRLRVALAHELTHVARWDVPWQSLSRLACCLCWVHPFVWLAAWRMRIEREHACDDAVLQLGTPSTDYARHLVELASALKQSTPPARSAVAMASTNNVEQRVQGILDPGLRRDPVGVRRGFTLLLTVASAATAAGLLRPAGVDRPMLSAEESESVLTGDTAAAAPNSASDNASDDKDKTIEPPQPESTREDNLRRTWRTEQVRMKAARDLHGTWNVTSISHSGVDRPLAAEEYYQFIFDADKKTVSAKWKMGTNERLDNPASQFVVNPFRDPSELTIYGENMLVQAIYVLEGDRLKFAMYGYSQVERPTSFTVDKTRWKGSPLMVFNLRKAEPQPRPNDGPANQDTSGSSDATSEAVKPEASATRASSDSKSEPDPLDELGKTYLLAMSGYIQTVRDPRRLPELSHSSSLALSGPRFTDDDLAQLGAFKNPLSLGLFETSIRATGLTHLSNIPRLERLSLCGPEVTDEWLAMLPSIETLDELDLTGTAITDVGVQQLKRFPNLEKLYLNHTAIGDDGLEVLRHLPHLKRLSLRHTRVSDRGLGHLVHLPHLESFSLASPNVEGSGLVHLQTLKQLKTLQFVGPSVTDAWMRSVEPIRSVTDLELNDTNVSDAGLSAISQWTQLRSLWLNNNPLTDGVVEHLTDLFRLNIVEMKGTNVTPAGAAALRDALPDTGVVIDMADMHPNLNPEPSSSH